MLLSGPSPLWIGLNAKLRGRRALVEQPSQKRFVPTIFDERTKSEGHLDAPASSAPGPYSTASEGIEPSLPSCGLMTVGPPSGRVTTKA